MADNKDNIGSLVVQLKQQAIRIEQVTAHSVPREDVEAMLHDLIHTAAHAVYVLHRDQK